MEIFKPELVMVITCVKCRVAMFPAIYADGRCCEFFMMEWGKTNYKCPKCGSEKDVEHRHGRRL